jgi:CDP-diacylglycerol--glycerol-3-phosphate 3-phosphatidyltransferase
VFQEDESHRKILASPIFWVKSKDITVLSTPQEFYSELISQSRSARERVSLASLYLGTGEMEQSLLASIASNYRRQKDLKVRFVIDKNRGTRIEQRSTSQAGQSAATLFQSTVGSIATDTLFDERSDTSEFRLGLFDMPLRPDDWFARFILPRLPPRYNELLTTFHLKAYAFDDTLIMTGANLSGDYFTTRQDRYWVVRDAPLAALYHDMIDILCDASHSMDGGNSSSSSNNNNNRGASERSSQEKDDGRPRTTHEKMKARLEHLMQPPSTSQPQPHMGWTCIQPTIQCAALGMRHDEMLTNDLLVKLDGIAEDEIENLQKTAYVSTGYLNFHDHFTRLLLKLRMNVTVLAASPEANGFFNASGISGSLPVAYSVIGQRLLRAAHAAKKAGAFQMCEYRRRGWTYHAKGLWFTEKVDAITPPKESSQQDGTRVGCSLASEKVVGGGVSGVRSLDDSSIFSTTSVGGLTMVGSPNFGYRSVERDFESSLLIVTEDERLQFEMERELNDLMTHVHKVDLSEFQKTERKLAGLFSWKNGWWISPASRVVRDFM